MFWLYVCSEDDTICFVERVSLRRSEPVPVGAGAGFYFIDYSNYANYQESPFRLKFDLEIKGIIFCQVFQ